MLINNKRENKELNEDMEAIMKTNKQVNTIAEATQIRE